MDTIQQILESSVSGGFWKFIGYYTLIAIILGIPAKVIMFVLRNVMTTQKTIKVTKVKFIDAPIGARFKFPGSYPNDIWIKVNSYENQGGLIAKWNGNNTERQSLRCWVDEENGYNFNTEIELV